ncbi:ATP-dependent zinc metalloprotease FtsH [Dissostichus eleginoides]|uniref:ATP-dependent zinc metalloprotease FtsH n=1 Tax=Dissostichus eleginoides TaxID=100907 RepID=A0AAD9BFB9_DISEL|nr:ATP-dependent zinc metalloprotease FtsH [Dissostichus eleginoides]
MQLDMGFEILASVRGVSVEDVYKLVDAHMTDSTEHNKGFSKLLAQMYNLETPAGQIFCGTHTTLGFSSAMNKVMRLVEADMKMEQLLQSFMVDLDVDSKNASVAGQALDMCLKLVAPEYAHKPWNGYREFLLFLEQRQVFSVLFSYKDSRFGCLSRAAAVLIYHFGHLTEFLSQNPRINNRLACLVREVMELPYLKVVLVVFACLGVHLVEPFYARTIEKDATHTQLREFYKGLHTGLGEPISDNYTMFTTPEYPVVSDKLFSSVKTYTEEVLNSVSDVAAEHLDEVKKLTDLMQPHLQTVQARQRRDYGIDEETFPMDYPVSEQASNIDDTPVHNIGMERQCGKVDYRLKKLGTLNAVSRSIILQKSQELRDGQIPSFRGFKAAAQAKREVELNWSKLMKAKFESGADQKQEMAQRKERKRLDMLDTLKSRGGPFTDSGEVEKFLVDESLNNNAKLQRMKLEVQFARESTTLLPKVDPIFRIQVTLPSGKRRIKTAQEFGDALMAYLGKRRTEHTGICKIQESLERLRKMRCYLRLTSSSFSMSM